MSEAYNPRKLKRDWIAKIAAGARPRDPQQAAIAAQAAFEQRQRMAKLDGARRVVHCHHDVPWLDCRICSKPRSRQ